MIHTIILICAALSLVGGIGFFILGSTADAGSHEDVSAFEVLGIPIGICFLLALLFGSALLFV